MDDKEEFKKVIEQFFANAGEQDLRELEAFLAQQEKSIPQNMRQGKEQKRRGPIGKMDVNNIANRLLLISEIGWGSLLNRSREAQGMRCVP